MQRLTCQSAGEQQTVLLQEASREVTGLQRQPRQHRAARQQTGQGLRHSVAQRIHAEVELLQTLRGKRSVRFYVTWVRLCLEFKKKVSPADCFTGNGDWFCPFNALTAFSSPSAVI